MAFNFAKIDIQIVIFSKIMYICSRRPQYRSPVGVRVAGCGHFRKRLLTLFLDSSKSGKFQSSSRMQQTVDAFVDRYIMPIASVRTLVVGAYHNLREASAGLLVQRRWALPEPR